MASLLEMQVRRLRARKQFKVVAVVGSIGKTSTKLAVAKVLAATKQVRYQEGNYNDRVTVPLIFFGFTEPPLFNLFAWLGILLRSERLLHRPYPYEVVVLELGTDGPGFMKEFAYTRPDVAVVTAITPEHMAFFKSLDAVAAEELAVMNYSGQVLINIDDAPTQYLVDKSFTSYGTSEQAEYRLIKSQPKGLEGQVLTLRLGKSTQFSAPVTLLGEQGGKIVLAAASVAAMLGCKEADIRQGINQIKPVPGRMQVLAGIKDSTIIDDTYNASPAAVKAALDVLSNTKAPQRIAILGTMNELGDYAAEAHKEAGSYCNPQKLDLVVTIGQTAEQYLAPAAKTRGCKTKSFLSPYEAGEYIKKNLKSGGVVLAKGSQNRVFAEEALKSILVDPNDAAKLVRQSNYWMNIKREQFL